MTDPITREPIDVPIDCIDADVSNHRLHEDADRIRELAESIERRGLLQPIRVYLKNNGSTKNTRYTLGFGFRRLAAFRALKRSTIPAFVFPSAAEDEIRADQAIENLQREDLTPLEETTACEAIVQSLRARGPVYDDNTAAATCAAMIGRPRKWVESRLALLRLSPRVRQLLMDGEIYLGHAQLLAQLASFEEQEEIAGRVKARSAMGAYHSRPIKGDRHPPSSVAETRYLVQERMRSLERVPWQLDVEFAGKPACSACPENAANAPGLFDGDEPRKAVCLNAACYREKAKQSQSAVQRASNTLAKMEAKPTPAQAKKAMAERGVEFVQPRIVAEHAKRKLRPKEATPAEKRGTRTAIKVDKVEEKYRQALYKWEHAVGDRVIGLLRASPWRVAIIRLLYGTSSYGAARPTELAKSKKGAHAAWRKIEPIVRGLSQTDDKALQALLVRLVQDLADEIADARWFVEDAYGENPDLHEVWAEVFPDVLEAVGPKPRKEQFEAAPTKKKRTTKSPPNRNGAVKPTRKSKPPPASTNAEDLHEDDLSTGTIELSDELLVKLARSGDIEALGGGTVKGPFKHNGAVWAKTGAVWQANRCVSVTAYQLIPADEYCGQTRTTVERCAAVRKLEEERLYVSAEQLRVEYEGDLVTYRGKPHVLTGRMTFVPPPASAVKKGTPAMAGGAA